MGAMHTEEGQVTDWYMLTLIGEDRAGIVAAVTRALYDRAMSLGETSMMRLGGSFTIMMMVSGRRRRCRRRRGAAWPSRSACGRTSTRSAAAAPARGAERARARQRRRSCGIVAQVTGAGRGGFNILDLASDVAGTERQPVYIMHIEGYSDAPLEQLQAAVAPLAGEGVDVQVSAIDTLYG